MAPLDDEFRLAAVEAKVAALEIELAQMLAGMYIARWVVGVSLALMTIGIGLYR